jgi:biotin carboxyl carrier protein
VRVGGVLIEVSVNGGRRFGRKDEVARAGGSGPLRVVAPMPGKIVRVLVRTGEAVQARQPLIVIEAMKMENELRAAAAGTVAEVLVEEGQSVEAGALLAVVHRS